MLDLHTLHNFVYKSELYSPFNTDFIIYFHQQAGSQQKIIFFAKVPEIVNYANKYKYNIDNGLLQINIWN